MTMTAQETGLMLRAAELVDEASRHCEDAAIAHSRGDHSAVGAAHVKLGRSLRNARAAFQRLGQTGAQIGSDKSHTSQVSDGTSVGAGVSAQRTGSPLLYGDVAGWLERARLGSRGR